MRVSSHANGGAGSARAPLLGLMALEVIVLGCALHPLSLGGVAGAPVTFTSQPSAGRQALEGRGVVPPTCGLSR